MGSTMDGKKDLVLGVVDAYADGVDDLPPLKRGRVESEELVISDDEDIEQRAKRPKRHERDEVLLDEENREALSDGTDELLGDEESGPRANRAGESGSLEGGQSPEA